MSQTFDRSVSIQYLPYAAEAEGKNLQAGLFLFPGFVRQLDPATRPTGGGKVRYITGLEIEDYPESEREEVLKVKKELEDFFGEEEMAPSNAVFWESKSLLITKKTTFLNMIDPRDKLTYYMIRGGAFKEVAPSYEKATNGAVPYRWYLIDATEFADIGVLDDRKINKAIAALEMIDEDKRFEDLFLVHKVLISSDRGTTMKSPRSMLYKDLSDFIHGKIVKTNKKQTAKQFLDAVELLKKDKKTVYLTAYVKDGSYYNFLTISEDNQIKNIQTGTKYGPTTDRAVRYLSSPANQPELDNLKGQVDKKWNE
jgi:hypothetical protein